MPISRCQKKTHLMAAYGVPIIHLKGANHGCIMQMALSLLDYIGKESSPWLCAFRSYSVRLLTTEESLFYCCLLIPQQLCCQSDAVPLVNGAIPVTPPRWWRTLSLIHLFYTGSENKTTVCAYTEAPGLTGTCRLTRHSASVLFSTRSNINKWMCSFGERRL